MKYQSSFDTPESIKEILDVLSNHGAEVTSVTDQKVNFVISEDSEYDLGVAISSIVNDLIDEAGVSVNVSKPVPVKEETAKDDSNVTLVDLVKSVRPLTKEEANQAVTNLKLVHTAIEDQLKRIAIDHQLYISLGDYGYGRSINGAASWNDSGCEWETSSEPEWQSSSWSC
jgi:hypothetical protein